MTMHELYAQFGLDVMTIDFIGHALALHQNDAYMMQVCVSVWLCGLAWCRGGGLQGQVWADGAASSAFDRWGGRFFA